MVRLQSNPFVHTPGFIEWLKNMFRSDPLRAVFVLGESYPDLPAGLTFALLDGRLETRIEGGDLVLAETFDPAPNPYPPINP